MGDDARFFGEAVDDVEDDVSLLDVDGRQNEEPDPYDAGFFFGVSGVSGEMMPPPPRVFSSPPTTSLTFVSSFSAATPGRHFVAEQPLLATTRRPLPARPRTGPLSALDGAAPSGELLAVSPGIPDSTVPTPDTRSPSRTRSGSSILDRASKSTSVSTAPPLVSSPTQLPPPSAPAPTPPSPPKRRGPAARPKTQEELDARRENDLERNREAAKKCRQRKKVNEEALKQQLMELTTSNQRLLHDSNCLKEECEKLKEILRAHGHCNDPRIDQWIHNEANRIVASKTAATLSQEQARYGPPISAGAAAHARMTATPPIAFGVVTSGPPPTSGIAFPPSGYPSVSRGSDGGVDGSGWLADDILGHAFQAPPGVDPRLATFGHAQSGGPFAPPQPAGQFGHPAPAGQYGHPIPGGQFGPSEPAGQFGLPSQIGPLPDGSFPHMQEQFRRR